MLLPTIQLLGSVWLARFLYQLGAGIYSFFREGKRLSKYGKWAVVTGATDGIGKEMAKEMVKQAMNVIIVSRTQAKLDETAKELTMMAKTRNLDVTIETLCIDFTKFGGPETEPYQRAAKAFEGKEIGVLVNNVGVSYEFPMFFHEIDDARVSALLKVNMDSVVHMTRLVIGGMVERKRGAILNLSSSAGVTPSPLLALYGATKAFVDKFSQELHAEYSGRYNIVVQSQTPLWIATKMASVKREKASLATPLPEKYAEGAVARIGYGSSNAGYWVHDMVVFAIDLLSAIGLRGVMGKAVLQMHEGIRKKGFKKRAAAEEKAK
eukprot:TRINITY_DN20989_c0_g1_i1.p1 TRINITY_DN20989_c0_g1~~TRINITY_DN20989_c0_g1_i1.p1  ORF type:complete len:322 (-),score=80.00 TRINITY_DN20989_c0_g1_i1:306-1271(-)